MQQYRTRIWLNVYIYIYTLDILIHLRFADIGEFIFWPLLAMVMTCTIVTRHLRNVMTHLYISGMYYCWVYFLIFWYFWKAKTAVSYLWFVLCSTASGFCFFIFWKLVHLWVTTSNEAKDFANPQFPQTWQTDDIRKASFDTPLRMRWEHITQNASCHQSTSTKLCLDYPWLSYVCNYICAYLLLKFVQSRISRHFDTFIQVDFLTDQGLMKNLWSWWLSCVLLERFVRGEMNLGSERKLRMRIIPTKNVEHV